MALTPTTADSVLKEFYLPSVRNQLNSENWWLAQIESRSDNIEGRRAVLALKVRRGSGIGARGVGGTLPTAGNAAYAEERVSTKRVYGRIEIDGGVIAKMKSDRGSFVRAVESEMSDVTEGLKRDVNRQLWGTSDGKIATATVSTTGQTTVLLATATSNVQMGQFEEGMLVDIGTVAEAVAGTGGPTYGNAIVSIDEDAKSFVVTTNLGSATAATDFVFRAGAGGATTNQLEVTGIQTIVDSTGALFNVDPSTYGVWASSELSNSGTNRSLSDDLLGQAMHKVQRKSGIVAGSQYVLAASDGVFRAYAASLTPMKRFPSDVNLKGGFKGLEVLAGGNPVALVWERDCPANSVYYLNRDHFALNVESDWDWMDRDGAVLNRVANKDAYEAVIFRYMEQSTDQRNAHAKILDVVEA